MRPNVYDEDSRRLRVGTLITLRWIAIIGQTIACLVIYLILNFDFPVGLCFVFIVASGTLNFGLRFGTSGTFRLSDLEAVVLLSYDLIQLSFLLYLTGGVTNPFVMLLLAPVTISAVSLPRNLTLFLGITMLAAATFLCVEFEPLPWYENEALRFPLLYRASIWASLALSAAFIALYAARVSDEGRLLATALAATELVLEREQHLSQLDGLAAAAAHELGTPLATITLIIRELQKSSSKCPAEGLKDDLDLLAQEAGRCREILGKLASLGADQGTMMNVLSIDTLIEEVVEPQREFGVKLDITKRGAGAASPPALARNPAILYGLGNLVENAIDFAETRVRIDAWWSRDLVTILIEDDGPGFSPTILDRLGDPYLRGRPTERRTKNDSQSGLGLGLFIAKTLLERSGATVETYNVSPPRTGAVVKVTWPRPALEISTGKLAASGA
ncbi:ActS/PrrB/RegB family redox-sensitive histidine kinase [Methylocystis parvus]|uniref:histidine kinase n=1 Tax=Methylocystis parvus TaxID=134 RepID=A0A6B8MAL1_9HYPH|nr:ActS/PrrB/RegB family redox-sensitive histidine kinase [Methylocystis parvus]QGM99455.1 ActS/PrrB/RegB family redox-sensitive histidine kinase [Methylocystis parvus]WBK00152.1 ActS/PrrB/RegB family redox-sensitive histidine kinase [Methylocystis parvus OBBP]